MDLILVVSGLQNVHGQNFVEHATLTNGRFGTPRKGFSGKCESVTTCATTSVGDGLSGGFGQTNVVACPRTNECYVLTVRGSSSPNDYQTQLELLPIHHGIPATPVQLGETGSQISGSTGETITGWLDPRAYISCWSASKCLVTGTYTSGRTTQGVASYPEYVNFAITLTNGSLGTPRTTAPFTSRDDGLGASACAPLSSTCFALSGAVQTSLDPAAVQPMFAPFRAGLLGSPFPVGAGFYQRGLACESATTCFGVGITDRGTGVKVGVVVPIVDGSPRAPIKLNSIPFGLWGVSCPNVHGCYAIGGGSQGVLVTIGDPLS